MIGHNSNLPLDLVAKEINTRFAKAKEIELKAEEHRIAAGMRLIEARQRIDAGEAGETTWEKWCASNIDRSQGDIRRVMRIAGATDPAAALAADRAAGAARVAKYAATHPRQALANAGHGDEGEEPPMSGAELEQYEAQRQRDMGGLENQTCPTTPWQRAVARKIDFNNAGPQVEPEPDDEEWQPNEAQREIMEWVQAHPEAGWTLKQVHADRIPLRIIELAFTLDEQELIDTLP